MRKLSGMVVVITGASSGIGEELARQLQARGCKLVLAARRVDRLDALNADLGKKHLIVPTDVAVTEECQHLIKQTIQHFGRIDTLVANAGFGLYDPVATTPAAETRAIFATNVFGTTDCISAAVPPMERQSPVDGWRGQIMIVSSVAARRAVPYLGIYSATKSAQLSIAEALRVELRPRQIAVTSIHPTMTRTEFGSAAETRSGVVLPRGVDRMTQSVDHVARRMIRAIERPTAEVWPSRPMRVFLGVGSLMPRLVDRALRGYKKQVDAINPDLQDGRSRSSKE